MVDNHGNTEIMTFVKCHEFAKMTCFGQNATFLHFLQEYYAFSQQKLKFIVSF